MNSASFSKNKTKTKTKTEQNRKDQNRTEQNRTEHNTTQHNTTKQKQVRTIKQQSLQTTPGNKLKKITLIPYDAQHFGYILFLT